MDKIGSKLSELTLPKLKLNPDKRLAVFGTGEVAERFLYDISEEYGEDIIEFFIDSRSVSEDFHGKRIVKPDFLKSDPVKNDRCYLLASFSSTASMRKLLIDSGISGKNILEPMKRCSVDIFMDTIDEVKNILLYPVVSDIERVKYLMNDIDFFIPYDSSINIDLFASFEYTGDLHRNMCIRNSGCEKLDVSGYDVILIWDSRALLDDELADTDKAFCIDSELLLHQNTKIFGAINNKIIDKKQRDRYRELSLDNWQAIEKKAEMLQRAYVFGSGPSMSDYVYSRGMGSFSDGISIVCNEFHNSARIMEIINPDIYVLFDLAFFGHRLSDSLEHIIEVIRDTKCKLVVPDLYVAMLHRKYNLSDDKLIGIDTSARDINIPTSDNLNVCKSNNVVCVFSLPIATGLCHEVYIIGCDGRDESFSWGHSREMLGEETKNGVEQDSKLGIDGERRKYNEHCDYMRRIIELGEKNDTRYYTLTKSYIPVLKDRKKVPKVSVIVPIYNSEKYLKRCVDSLINQTLDDIEIILVDDASEDNSKKIMQSYESQYADKIKCIYLKQNLRQGGARNAAIKEAEGEYITYVDSDDFIDINMCEKLYKRAHDTDSDIVFCDYYECSDDLQKKKWVSVFFRQQTGKIDYKKRKYLFFQKAMCCGKLIRTSLIKENDIYFPEKLRYEDIAVTLLYSLYANRIEKVYEPLYYYIQNADSTSNYSGKELYKQHMQADLMMLERLRDRGFFDSYRDEAEAYLLKYSPVIMLYGREKNPAMSALDEIAGMHSRITRDFRENKYFNRDILEPFYKKCVEVLYDSPSKLPQLYNSGQLECCDYSYYYYENKDALDKLLGLCSERSLRMAVWGAGKKGDSFLKIIDSDCDKIRCVIDKNENKHNTLMPTGHEIKKLESAISELDVILVMNKHYFECVKDEVKKLDENIKLVNLDMYLLMQDDYPVNDFFE